MPQKTRNERFGPKMFQVAEQEHLTLERLHGLIIDFAICEDSQ